jgi:DNA primase
MEVEKLKELLESLGVQRLRLRRRNLQGCCPAHRESRPSWGISVDPPHFHYCFSCGFRGSLASLLQKGFGYSREDANRIGGIEDTVRKDVDFSLTDKEYELDLVDYRLLFQFERALDYKPARNYLNKRRMISDATAEKAGLLFDPAQNRILFPWRISGNLYCITGRAIDDNKVKTLPYFESRKGQCFYFPFESCLQGDYLVCVEGETDALKVAQAGYPAAALGFGTITYKAVEYLKKIKPDLREVVCFFDNDGTGRRLTEDAFEAFDCDVTSVDYDLVLNHFFYRHEQKLDPGCLLTPHIKLLIDGRKKCVNWPTI